MRIALAILILINAASGVLPAQSSSIAETAQIFDATVRALYQQTHRQILSQQNVEIKVDPIIFEPSRGPAIDSAGAKHTEEVLSRMRAFSGASIVTSARARECAAYAPADCMSNGVSAVANFSNPVILRDSGYVDVFLRASRHVSAEDSLAFAGRRGGGRGQMNLRRAGASTLRALLAKTPAGWVVTGIVLRGQR